MPKQFFAPGGLIAECVSVIYTHMNNRPWGLQGLNYFKLYRSYMDKFDLVGLTNLRSLKGCLNPPRMIERVCYVSCDQNQLINL